MYGAIDMLLSLFPIYLFSQVFIHLAFNRLTSKKLKFRKYCRHTLCRISTQRLSLLSLARLQDQKTMFKERCLYIHFFLIHFILHPSYLFSIWSKLKVSNICMNQSVSSKVNKLPILYDQKRTKVRSFYNLDIVEVM